LERPRYSFVDFAFVIGAGDTCARTRRFRPKRTRHVQRRTRFSGSVDVRRSTLRRETERRSRVPNGAGSRNRRRIFRSERHEERDVFEIARSKRRLDRRRDGARSNLAIVLADYAGAAGVQNFAIGESYGGTTSARLCEGYQRGLQIAISDVVGFGTAEIANGHAKRASFDNTTEIETTSREIVVDGGGGEIERLWH